MRKSLGLMLLTILLFVIGCQEPPLASLNAAERALNAAFEARARLYADSLYREAEWLLDAGRLETAHQKGRLAFLRDYAKADSMLKLSAALSDTATQRSVDSLATLKTIATTHVNGLEDEIIQWREILDGTLILFRAEREWSNAEMSFHQAKELLNADEFAEAIIQVEKTHQILRKLNTVFREYSYDEANHNGLWQRLVQNTLEESRSNGSYAIIVDKATHKTYLINSGEILKSYPCDLGYNSAGQKTFAGDGATPEGQYRITKVKNGSKYYRALLLDYPNAADMQRFRENKRKGLISSRARIGRLIEIHGDGGQSRDWTDGCVALSNHDMDDVMKYVGEGTPVTIVRRWNGARKN